MAGSAAVPVLEMWLATLDQLYGPAIEQDSDTDSTTDCEDGTESESTRKQLHPPSKCLNKSTSDKDISATKRIHGVVSSLSQLPSIFKRGIRASILEPLSISIVALVPVVPSISNKSLV